MSRKRLGGLLFATAVVVAGLILWSKVRVFFFVPLSIGGLFLLAAGLILVIYLALRSIFFR